jgi:cupin fold WbuC family metalloprotein
MSRALPNPAGSVFTLDEEVILEGLRASRSSKRLRIIVPVQRSQEAQVQRLLNFLQPGTYIRPHCHPAPHASESICLLRGSLQILIFDKNGFLTKRHLLSETGDRLIDLEPGIWHGMIVMKEDTVIFEVKRGPYDPGSDKEFATWAPEEGSSEAPKFLQSLSS